MTFDDLNKMKLHEIWNIDDKTQIMCVTGGWIYLHTDNVPNTMLASTFVPQRYVIHGTDITPLAGTNSLLGETNDNNQQ